MRDSTYLYPLIVLYTYGPSAKDVGWHEPSASLAQCTSRCSNDADALALWSQVHPGLTARKVLRRVTHKQLVDEAALLTALLS